MFSTVGGLAGDYENFTLQQLRELEGEERQRSALERNRANLSSQEQIALRELQAVQRDVDAIRADVTALETRIASARRSGAANAQQLFTLEQRLASVRAEDQRLAVAMNNDAAMLEELRARRDALAGEAEALERLVETLGF
ncbi:hypothetical protein [Oceanicaulis sp.]|uniref:hypothetical protein n=1 Tax=Oceanicaulis sp. TaxID=1924941 RepID=UPI003D28CF68